MKQHIFCLVFLIIFSTPTLAFDIPQDVTFIGLEKMSQVVMKTVFSVQVEGNRSNESTEDDWNSLGTGFFVSRDDDAIIGITCFHVVQNSVQKGQKIYVGIDTDKGYHRSECNIEILDEKNDVAVLLPLKGSIEASLKNLVFTTKQFANADSIVEGKAVIIPGYPLGLGVYGDINHPVIRIGIIAQRQIDRHILIDGITSHGNSGSPVVLMKDVALAGMVTSHVSDFINLLDENGRVSARLPYNSGIGRAVSSDTILGVLEKMKKK